MDIDAIILDDDPSQTAPVCNGTVQELIDEIRRLRAEIGRLEKYRMGA